MSIMRFGVSSFISKSSDSNTFIFVLCFDIIGVPTGPRNAIAMSNVMFVFSRYLNASHQIVLLFLQKVNLSKHFDINAENGMFSSAYTVALVFRAAVRAKPPKPEPISQMFFASG